MRAFAGQDAALPLQDASLSIYTSEGRADLYIGPELVKGYRFAAAGAGGEPAPAQGRLRIAAKIVALEDGRLSIELAPADTEDGGQAGRGVVLLGGGSDRPSAEKALVFSEAAIEEIWAATDIGTPAILLP
ncbi:MAG: hypothetical protein BWZ10_01669 [candidate division BRC1 bacterium ADurb.BinA364]|nr:MAG: hypothetical protein BWZ10_01669 [candidate division BRC1 bacterium ADurb.BinA364]